jgi:glucokinase
MILAGDVGGTKTALAVFSRETGPFAPIAEATFPSAGYPCLEDVLRTFLAEKRLPVEQAIFGVAGPVVGGRATVTNLPWIIDEVRLREQFQWSSARLINDLVATAYAIPHLRPEDLRTLSPGTPERGGAIAVIAPGTGLGEAFLIWEGRRYRPHPSEGGHADFGPTSPRQMELLAYLQRQEGHVSYERVCSGLGLPHLYAYLRDSRAAEEPGWLAAQLRDASDPTPVIVAAALAHTPPSDLAVATIEIFVSILGAEAGNLALKILATGGVYLGGGMPRRILPALENGPFIESFRRKGRMSDLLARIPVSVILHPEAALMGAACAGLDL